MKNKRDLILFIIFIVLEVLLTFTGLGFIGTEKFSFTPVIVLVVLGVLLLRWPFALFLGIGFGLMSMYESQDHASDIAQLFMNPCISIIPRILCIATTYPICYFLKKNTNDHTLSSALLCSINASFVTVLSNAIYVLVAINFFSSNLENHILQHLYYYFEVILKYVNIEILICLVTVTPLYLWLTKGEWTSKYKAPIQTIARKWFVLIIGGASVLMITGASFFHTKLENRKTDALILKEIDTLKLELDENGYDEMHLRKIIPYYHIGLDGSLVYIHRDTVIASSNEFGNSFKSVMNELRMPANERPFVFEMNEYYYRAIAVSYHGDLVIGLRPNDEVIQHQLETLLTIILSVLLIFGCMYIVLFVVFNKNITLQIRKINHSLAVIRSGNLDETIQNDSNLEFTDLSNDINSTVNALKSAKEAVAEKIASDLALARNIQFSALPNQPDISPLCQIATFISPAKEVGGDMFDYFKTPDDRIAILIADVSGKGIPAALFMMRTKAILKNNVLLYHSPAEIIHHANLELCEDNETEMFVTAWLGLLNPTSGELVFTNAGHHPPFIKSGDGSCRLLDSHTYKRSLMLGVKDCARYEDNHCQLCENDTLFLYTDGITEALNTQNAFYGIQRLEHLLKCIQTSLPDVIIQDVQDDVSKFTEGAEQFDDMTMLAITRLAISGAQSQSLPMNTSETLHVSPDIEGAEKLARMTEQWCEAQQIPSKITHRCLIILDELFSNIRKYSGATQCTFTIGLTDKQIYMKFEDDGNPFNPLCQSADEVMDLPVDQRPPGGYGLQMVKKMSAHQSYEYVDHQNRITVTI